MICYNSEKSDSKSQEREVQMKQEKGSVTMVVVVTIFFIVILLSSFFIYTTSRRRAQLEETRRIANSYDGDMNAIYEKISEEDKQIEFDTAYGRIEVIWLDTDNNVINEPNSPASHLGGMTPVYWTGTPGNYEEHQSNDITNNANNIWYSYTSINSTNENTTSKWANAIDGKGNYFVWVPRYAYRITYYATPDRNEPTGYYDGRGLVDSKGEPVTEIDGSAINGSLEQGIETVEYNGESYIVHPAFMDDFSDDGDDTNDYTHGGWDSDLAGIWVGKYATSGSTEELKIVPNGKYVSESVSNCYDLAKGYNRNGNPDGNLNGLDSHLMKNSEWGATAYLTYSQYGRNGYNVATSNSRRTGCFVDENGSEEVNRENEYNTENGEKSSSTGNVYGIYDLSGGAYEFVAAWNTKSNSIEEGNSMVDYNGLSNKYATAYSEDRSKEYEPGLYDVGKTGDATKETYMIRQGMNWDENLPFMFSRIHENTFFARGGNFNLPSAGIFASEVYADGGSSNISGFRITLSENI